MLRAFSDLPNLMVAIVLAYVNAGLGPQPPRRRRAHREADQYRRHDAEGCALRPRCDGSLLKFGKGRLRPERKNRALQPCHGSSYCGLAEGVSDANFTAYNQTSFIGFAYSDMFVLFRAMSTDLITLRIDEHNT